MDKIGKPDKVRVAPPKRWTKVPVFDRQRWVYCVLVCVVAILCVIVSLILA